MSKILNKEEIEKFSRQIILKDIGSLGQKKIKQAKELNIQIISQIEWKKLLN